MKRFIAILLALTVAVLPLTVSAEEEGGGQGQEEQEEPEIQLYKLTVDFVYADGSKAYDSYEKTGLAEGDSYDVDIPVIDGYTADKDKLQGTMPAKDLKLTVKYTADEPAGDDDDQPEGDLTLTIHYVNASGEAVADDKVVSGIGEGYKYEIASPSVEGMAPDKNTVSGVMGASDETVTVTYTEASDEPVTPGEDVPGGGGGFPGGGGMPSGGFPGGGSLSLMTGAAAIDAAGMEGMLEDMDTYFKVTPGTAFTSIHSKTGGDDSLYGTIDPENDDTGIVLTYNGEQAGYVCLVHDGILTVEGAEGNWQFTAETLRTLAKSGIETLELVTDAGKLSIPTDDYAEGYTYASLRALGLNSSAFILDADGFTGDLCLTVNGETYAVKAEGGDIKAKDIEWQLKGE